MERDPYKYFRIEARELLDGLTQGVLELEKGADGRHAVGNLLRLAHTLKGASRVVRRPEIAELAHAAEDVLGPYREHPGAVPRERVEELLRLLDGISAGLKLLESPPGAAGSTAPRPPAEPFQTVRVEVEELNELLGSLSEVKTQLAGLRNESEGLKRSRNAVAALVETRAGGSQSDEGSGVRTRPLAGDVLGRLERLERSLVTAIDRAQRELGQARECASRLRLAPAGSIFPALARAVSDAARGSGKRAELETAGGEVRLETNVLNVLGGALLHLVRNAVAHGIETPEDRIRTAKNSVGRVRLEVQPRGDRIAFICRDDGRGFDVSAVRQAAIQRGVLTPAQAQHLGTKEAIDLLLRCGLTTTPAVTQLSGRGIGLDVVREAAARLKGTLSIHTEPGIGSWVEVCVPVSLASALVLLVEASGQVLALPLENVRSVSQIPAKDVARSGKAVSVPYEGRTIPFLPLRDVTGGPAPAVQRARWQTVVMTCGEAMAALGVDRLLGTTAVVAHSLPDLAAADPIVARAFFNAEGAPQLLLNPASLIEAAARGSETAAEVPARQRPPILIIDDSLTTRMLEQSILESAGHTVEVAASGEEALEKARARPYSLFLVDVEMPGIDGFEFVSRTRHDPDLREIPSILVTSRSSPEDRRRGLESGARAYIVKSEFDQNHLIETVRQLAG